MSGEVDVWWLVARCPCGFLVVCCRWNVVVESKVAVSKHVPTTRLLLLMTDFLLNCFVLGDDEERIFPVKIPRNDNVGILKKLIKEENPHALDRVDAKDLDLWEVCLPIDDPASKQPQAGPPLRVNKRLSSLWNGEPSEDELHILVKAPGAPQPIFVLFSTKSKTYSRLNSYTHSYPQLSFIR
jgi:hypothetical protein